MVSALGGEGIRPGTIPARYALRARTWHEGRSGARRRLVQRAAEQGNVKAMHNLAVLSANQRGGSPDYAKAASWFGKAAEYGLADSQFNLAVLYENGLGVPEDLKIAYKWLAWPRAAATKKRSAAAIS